jgi:hypothetical protein
MKTLISCFRLTNKIFLVLILLFGFPYSNLLSDVVKLKNGQYLQGLLRENAKGQFILESGEGITKLTKDQIKDVELGFTGVSACLEDNKISANSRCGILLHKIHISDAQIAEGFGYLKSQKISLDHDFTINFEKKFESEKIIPTLREGIHIRLVTIKNQIHFGKITKWSQQELTLTPDDPKLSPIVLTEKEITKGSWTRDHFHMEASEMFYVVPGWKNVKKSEYKKGIGVFSAALLMGAGMGYEFYMARRAVLNDVDIIPVSADNAVLSNNVTPSNAFEMHKQRFYGYTFGLIAVIAWNFFDVAFYGKEIAVDNPNPLRFRFIPQTPRTFVGSESYMDFTYTFQF